MNMQLTLSVLRIVSSMTCQVSRPLRSAVMVAAAAPTAELSTRLVTPIRKSPVMQEENEQRNDPGAEQPELRPAS